MTRRRPDNRLLAFLERRSLCGLLLGLLVASTLGTMEGPLARLELGSLDFFLHLLKVHAGASSSPLPILIAAIDDRSLHGLRTRHEEGWPWRREIHARLVERLSNAGAQCIAFDVLFRVPRSHEAASDQAFRRAIEKAGSVILAASEERADQGRSQVVRPHPLFADMARGVGLVGHPFDEDDRIRRTELVHRQPSGELLFSFGFRVAAEVLQLDLEEAVLEEGESLAVPYRSGQGTAVFPLARNDDLLIRFQGPTRTFAYHSLIDLLEKPLPPEVSGAIVLVGYTSPTLQDRFLTPFSSWMATGDRRGSTNLMPGVEIHANSIDTFIRSVGDRFFLSRASKEANRFVLFLLGPLLGIVLARSRPKTGLLFLVLMILCGYAAVVKLCLSTGVVLDLVRPTMLVGLVFLGSLAYRYLLSEQRMHQLKNLIQLYVPRRVVERLAASADFVDEPGQKRVLTVLFVDIRDYTSLTETLGPTETVEFLNAYFETLSAIVDGNHGSLRYIGDAIMAVFGEEEVESQAEDALVCAEAFFPALEAFNAERMADGATTVRVGVGISTGEVVVGNLGSSDHLEYTVIGDTVNLASRLENLTKEHGHSILVARPTRDRARVPRSWTALGTVPVRGKKEPVEIFGLHPLEPQR